MPIKQEIIRFARKYHGYFFAWATIYTFWYHPMDNTTGHLIGFFYMFLLLLQGSLFLTRIHVNKYWTVVQEVDGADPWHAGGGDAGQRHLADVRSSALPASSSSPRCTGWGAACG